jgi:peptide/nickel transport system ATP-binding protein
VVAQIADHVAVMYAGQIVESATKEQFFSDYQHPYSKKLFEALPSEQKREQRLTMIKGTVPPLNQAFTQCRFVERCDLAWQHCHDAIPRWTGRGEHGVRCHLYDPDVVAPEHTSNGHTSMLSDVVPAEKNVIEVSNLKVHFPIKKGILQRTVGQVKAVDGIDIELKHAETLALVGESGCGKTTVGKGILQLVPVTTGEVRFADVDLNNLTPRKLKQYRSALQIIFQDPFSSMNPRMTIEQIIAEGMVDEDEASVEGRVDSLLERVGLRPDIKHRYPHEFSGGQRQRICIARALATDPEVIICDEPTSALDVSVQAQILNLLRDIQHEFGLSYLFITHNISVVNYLAHRVAVMYLGRIVEQGTREEVLNAPKHPYTQALLAAVPEIEPDAEREVIRLAGELPSPANPPSGCHFHQRCPQVRPECAEIYPEQIQLSETQTVKCVLYK